MKVILLRDVAKIGKRFEIVEVPDGFALNKLIPKKDAEPATPANVKRVQKNKERTEANKAEIYSEINTIVDKLNAEKIIIEMEANELGHLFQAVSTKDIVKSAKERGYNLIDDYIVINETIKSIGEHQIFVKNQDKKLPISIIVNQKNK